MRFVEFLPEHLGMVETYDGVDEKGMDLFKLGEACKRGGPCLSLFDGDTIVACGGITMPWPGMAYIWTRVSLKAGPQALKNIRGQMYRWAEENSLDRIQATAREDWEQDHKFLELMGMKRETLMEKYGPKGVNQILYAWVRK